MSQQPYILEFIQKNWNQCNISVLSFCYCSTIAKSQHMESVQVAISKWMDTQTSVYMKIE